MKYLSNAHTHTVFCDGKNTVEEMALAAIGRGFVSLGFSIHGWTPYDAAWLKPGMEEPYKEEVRRVAEKYADQIEILCGVECDALCAREYTGFEYSIDSTHVLEKDGEYLRIDESEALFLDNVNRHFDGDYYAYCRAYFEHEAQVCAKSAATFIGHIDLVSKYNEGNRYFDENDPRYLRPALEAAEIAVRRGIPIEMNTGAIGRGYRTTPYPHPEILRRIRALGGEILISSDAHAKETLDTGFDLCVELAKECGFDHVLRLRRDGFEEAPLD